MKTLETKEIETTHREDLGGKDVGGAKSRTTETTVKTMEMKLLRDARRAGGNRNHREDLGDADVADENQAAGNGRQLLVKQLLVRCRDLDNSSLSNSSSDARILVDSSSSDAWIW